MSVAVIATYQSDFKTSDPTKTFPEQAQEAALGAMKSVGMTPDDIDAVVFSLAPTFFMGVADADRWSVDHIFAAGKPIFRVHTGGPLVVRLFMPPMHSCPRGLRARCSSSVPSASPKRRTRRRC